MGLRYSVNALRLRHQVPASSTAGRADDAGRTPSGASFDVALGLGVVALPLQAARCWTSLEYREARRLLALGRRGAALPERGLRGHLQALRRRPSTSSAAPRWTRSWSTRSRQATRRRRASTWLPAQVDSHFFGATVGVAVGYKYVHLYAELTGGYTHCRPSVFGQKRRARRGHPLPGGGAAPSKILSRLLAAGGRPVHGLSAPPHAEAAAAVPAPGVGTRSGAAATRCRRCGECPAAVRSRA